MRAVQQGILYALAAAASAAAMADTVHHVRFAQPAQILVWEAGTLIARGDQINLTARAANLNTKLIGAGILQPVDDRPNGSMTIAIASNTAFSLKTRDPAAADDVVVRVLGAGENAQIRSQAAPNGLFRQSAKTAIRRGHPSSQAIELEISWSGAAAPTLTLTAD